MWRVHVTHVLYSAFFCPFWPCLKTPGEPLMSECFDESLVVLQTDVQSVLSTLLLFGGFISLLPNYLDPAFRPCMD